MRHPTRCAVADTDEPETMGALGNGADILHASKHRGINQFVLFKAGAAVLVFTYLR